MIILPVSFTQVKVSFEILMNRFFLVIDFCIVQDKGGIPWCLGISYKGISLYDHNDRKVPRRVNSSHAYL